MSTDITLCKNSECPVKMKCFRFTEKSLDPRQSYAKLEFKVKDGKVYCDYFLSNFK